MILVVAATERELALVEGVGKLCCGIGPVEAALATAQALADRPPRVLIQIGIAGARSLPPRTLVIGSEAVYCDILDGQASMPRVERVQAAPELVDAAQRALPDARVLPIATCGRVGAGAACDVEAMEGFGVLRAAQLAAVPAVEIRAISNSVHHADRSLWRIDDALAELARGMARLLPELDRGTISARTQPSHLRLPGQPFRVTS
jgi:futalosine hydrolase